MAMGPLDPNSRENSSAMNSQSSSKSRCGRTRSAMRGMEQVIELIQTSQCHSEVRALGPSAPMLPVSRVQQIGSDDPDSSGTPERYKPQRLGPLSVHVND